MRYLACGLTARKQLGILWIGACTGRQDKLCPEKDLKWVTDKLKALGVWISSDPMVSMEANHNENLLKIRNCLSCWEYRRLSLLGKIVVLKSLIASQLVYILSPLPTKHASLDDINNMFYGFLWTHYTTQSSTLLPCSQVLWSCRIKEVLPKIERFPSFLSFLVPSDS